MKTRPSQQKKDFSAEQFCDKYIVQIIISLFSWSNLTSWYPWRQHLDAVNVENPYLSLIFRTKILSGWFALLWNSYIGFPINCEKIAKKLKIKNSLLFPISMSISISNSISFFDFEILNLKYLSLKNHISVSVLTTPITFWSMTDTTPDT
jgi:hypothetical protein